MDAPARTCPACDDPIVFTFSEASGLGAWKQGQAMNVTPDTNHYVCFPCARAWKQRLDGPLTEDIVGDLAFFYCRATGCGERMIVTRISADPTGVEIGCSRGHRYGMVRTDEGGLAVEDAAQS